MRTTIEYKFSPGDQVKTLWEEVGTIEGCGWFRGNVIKYYVQTKDLADWFAPEVLTAVADNGKFGRSCEPA